MKNAFKNYNWEKFISDLVVVMLSAGLTFLVNWLGSLDMGGESSGVAGGIGLAINRSKGLFRRFV